MGTRHHDVYFVYNGIEECLQRSLSKYIVGYLLVQALVLVWLTPIVLVKVTNPGWDHEESNLQDF